MPHFRRSLLFIIVAMVAAVSSARAENKSPLAAMDLQDGDCVVFLGDSITHQRLYTQYVEDFFYTRFPTMRLRLHNAGVGGAKAWDALERFDRDVAAYKPKYVTVLLGMNDGRYQPFDQETWQTYFDDMTTLIQKIVAIKAVPVLMTPTMYDSRAALARKRQPAAHYNSVLAYYGTWLREVAVNEGMGFVDMWGPLNNLTILQRKTEPDFTMIQDAVHPGAPGQLVMAYAIIDDMGLRGAVSSTRLVVAQNGKVRVGGTGGQASDVENSDGSLAFTWTATCLPWVVPAEAQPGAALLKLGHRASREGFGANGLDPGKYELSIDGQVVGVFSDLQLARQIELQGNIATPQYQQALQVAELNKQRNEGPIAKLRGEWSQFQRFARARQQLQGSPDDDKLKAQLAALELKLEGMEERIAEYEAAAKEIEDHIFVQNQPKPRRYVLKRVEP